VNASTLRRLSRLETAAQESRRRGRREHLARLTAEHGIRLSPEAMEELVTNSLEREPRILRMRRAGIPDREIADILIGEIKAGKARQCEQG
jgi:hypothetical protein